MTNAPRYAHPLEDRAESSREISSRQPLQDAREPEPKYKPEQIVPFGTPLQSRRVIAEGTTRNGDPMQLVELGEGARLAGSVLCWARASFAVQTQSRTLGTRAGRLFSHDTEGERRAGALFAKWSRGDS